MFSSILRVSKSDFLNYLILKTYTVFLYIKHIFVVVVVVVDTIAQGINLKIST